MPNRHPSSPRTLPLIIFAVALALAIGAGSFLVAQAATFTDQASVTDNTFSTAESFGGCTAGNTGFLNPTAQAADTGGNGDGFELNPTNAFTDAGGYATNIGSTGDRHRFYNYDIAIPAGCSVAGIKVRLDWWLDNAAGTNSMSAELSWDGGNSWTAAKTDALETTTEHTALLGGSADTWGRTWTVAETTNANFRVRVTCDSTNARGFLLDWIPVQVYYTP